MLPPRGINDLSGVQLAGYRYLCIIALRPYEPTDVVYSQRTGLIHVTDVPDTVSFDKMQEELQKPWADIVAGLPVQTEKRAWRIDSAQLSAANLTTLLTTRQLTITAVKLGQALIYRDGPPGKNLNDFV